MKENINKTQQRILLFSVFILSLCGIIYELVLASLATYLLGNPVQQYSITIGVFLSSMGLGSYLSRFVIKDLIRTFVIVEILLGLVGGVSVIVLNYLFSFSASFYLLHVFLLIVIGSLVGLEIPLLTRILKKYGSLKEIISNVLTLDYVGGLAGSLLFPLILFPFLGRYLTSIVIGIANIAVALIVIAKIGYTGRKRTDAAFAIVSLLLLCFLAFNSEWITGILHKRMFYDDVVFSKRTKYQEIVLTRNGEDFRLYLDGSLQFSTSDEYRYHEMLICPALDLCGKPQDMRVLVMGGGDGLAVRDILKSEAVSQIVLVELDGEMLNLARENSTLQRINQNSLENSRVKVIAGDAYDYLVKSKRKFDVIIADFPDPHDETIAKLYTVDFFSLVRRSLSRNGVFVSQSTSPLFAREAFWCINNTMKKVFTRVTPYHILVPTFGDWGFNMATMGGQPEKKSDISLAMKQLRFYNRKTMEASLHFPPDSGHVKTDINTFNRPSLYLYYLKGWKNTDY